jgi:DNA-binding FrmR family transcriptional regulator
MRCAEGGPKSQDVPEPGEGCTALVLRRGAGGVRYAAHNLALELAQDHLKTHVSANVNSARNALQDQALAISECST